MPDRPWAPMAWRPLMKGESPYEDAEALAASTAELGSLPGLVTPWEIDKLRGLLAEAQEGKRFLLQGGDCAETFAECTPEIITAKLKALLQMSLVLMHGMSKPIVRVCRMAGQYAKPRSSRIEKRDGVALPSYFGDAVNRAEFTAQARKPDPRRMIEAYYYAGMTLNFMRAMGSGGFADLRHPEYWDMDFFERSGLPVAMRDGFRAAMLQVTESLRLMESLVEQSVDKLTGVDFFASHECLNLHYEAAQTKELGSHYGFYDLTGHFLWIGERTRSVPGAHVLFASGIRNPIGVKIGPRATPAELRALLDVLNPDNEAGRLAVITRMGAARVAEALPPLIREVRRARAKVLWVCDPMHGNTYLTTSGTKTRHFAEILEEVERTHDIHEREGSFLGGLHFEMTPEDVTECVGGAARVKVEDLGSRYRSLCDPRLNYRQALEMSFRVATRARASGVRKGNGAASVAPMRRDSELFRVAELNQVLLRAGDPRESLTKCFAEARRVLDSITAADVFRCILPSGAYEKTMALMLDVEHIGFLVVGDLDPASMASAAVDAGFASHRTFPSTILARELGWLLGRPAVPTTIFTAWATASRHVGIEAFIPAAEPSLVREWIGNGVGTHVGIGLRERSSFAQTVETFEAAGFRVPAFMSDGPMSNPLDRITTIYLDGEIEYRAFRIELFHREPPSGPRDPNR